MASAADHDRNLATAFDQQAAQFEKAPVQSDAEALAELVRLADLPPGSRVLDAGCGPGLVGIDLSAEMIERARRRCGKFGSRGQFRQGSVYDEVPGGPFDAVVSRYVLHHVADAGVFIGRQVDLLRPGGVLVLSDHTTDPDRERAGWHQALEKARDQTHTANLTCGQIADWLIQAGLGEIRLWERVFTLDFDEWFDRGSPSEAKETVRRRLTAGGGARGFWPTAGADGSIRIACWRVIVRGVKLED